MGTFEDRGDRVAELREILARLCSPNLTLSEAGLLRQQMQAILDAATSSRSAADAGLLPELAGPLLRVAG